MERIAKFVDPNTLYENRLDWVYNYVSIPIKVTVCFVKSICVSSMIENA